MGVARCPLLNMYFLLPNPVVTSALRLSPSMAATHSTSSSRSASSSGCAPWCNYSVRMSQSKIWVGPIVERCCDCEYNLKDLYSVYLTSDPGYHTTRSESEKELVEKVLANTNVSIVHGEAVKRLEASSLPPLMCIQSVISLTFLCLQ